LNKYEELLTKHGERSGVEIAIAVHSTTLGPALGGCRIWHYRRPQDGVTDALRLAGAMTMKAAAAGLDLGGGKSVIALPDPGRPDGDRRREILLDFADAVESLGGRYITAEDVGSCAADMAVISERTDHVVGLPPALGGRGDPSPVTARGVEQAIRACCEHRYGTSDLAGVRVCVIGLGHVGTALAGRLAAAGAELVCADVDPSRRDVAAELGAEWVDPEGAALTRCDVLAPCALGQVVDAANAEMLRCRIVCGAANNVLADEALAARLRENGVLYAPDFIANAGGLIHVYADLRDHDPAEVDEMVDSIGTTIARVLADADAAGTTSLAAARALAEARLAPVEAA
jgi:leucine dehydrogenase